MNIKIPVPAWLTRGLDNYSDWNAQPTGPTLRIASWRYTVLRRDWVSILGIIAISIVFAWMWDWSIKAVAISVVAGTLAWAAVEALEAGR